MKMERNNQQCPDSGSESPSLDYQQQIDDLKFEIEKYSVLFNNTIDAILIIDLDGKIIDVNQEACNRYGYKREQIVGMMVSKLDQLKDQLQVEITIDIILKNKKYTFRTIHIAKNGEKIFTEINSKLITYNNQTAIMSSCRNISDLKQIELDLITSREQLDSIIRTAPSGIGVFVNRIFKYANKHFLDQIGYSLNEIIGQDALMIYPDKDEYDRVGKELYSILEATGSGEIETRFKCKNGTIIDVALNASVISESDPSKGITFSINDITRQKRMAQALEQKLTSLTQPLNSTESISITELFNIDELQQIQDLFSKSTGVASIITQPDGTPITKPSNFTRFCNDIVRKNPIGCQNCYKSDAILGAANHDRPTISHCLSGGLWDAGSSIIVGGKHIANWLIGQVRDSSQSEDAIVKYAHEIGVDVQVMLEAFREVPRMSYDKFKSVAETLHLLSNQLSNTAYQNLQQARFIAERRKADRIIQDYNKTLREEVNKQTQELANTNKLLKEKIFEQEKTALQLKNAQHQLIQSEKLASIGQLAAGVAHEINSPLGAISSSNVVINENFDDLVEALDELSFMFQDNSDLLKKMLKFITMQESTILSTRQQRQIRQTITRELAGKTTLDEDYLANFFTNTGLADYYEQFLPLFNNNNSDKLLAAVQKITAIYQGNKVIQQAINQSSRIVFALREYAHSNETEKKTKANVKNTLETAITLYGNKIKHGIELILDLNDVPEIYCYPGELNQVWTNLIHNAVQAMDGVGILRISLNTFGENIEVAITDSGCGVPESIKDEIFKPLFTTKPPGMGTGLGLDIVNRIIKRHNGTISMESVPGQGATFTVRIPIVQSNSN